MKELPIIFSAAMVRALLDGRKTQTRRILKAQPPAGYSFLGIYGPRLTAVFTSEPTGIKDIPVALPYSVGDRLWVREACFAQSSPDGEGVAYPADSSWRIIDHTKEATEKWLDLLYYRRRNDDGFEGSTGKLVPPIHMPRWASRITLEVTEVRVQRLQEISGEDTIVEGVQCPTCEAMKYSACHDSGCFHSLQLFKELWNGLHGPGAWEANPWVAAISFKRIT